MNSEEELTAAAVDALEALQIDYMLVGAYSSNAYGIARSTHDADFVVVVQPGQLRALVERLGPEFSLDRQIRMEGITGSVRNIITHQPTHFDIELFRLNAKDEHHDERFRRRHPIEEIQRDAWIPTPEDVVIQNFAGSAERIWMMSSVSCRLAAQASTGPTSDLGQRNMEPTRYCKNCSRKSRSYLILNRRLD
ncbi:MAG: hypothetical protein IAG10_17615 [Planctomycetaceae bacterium]|nr:hypothetical protein [Planctomycetaceae bacterium]